MKQILFILITLMMIQDEVVAQKEFVYVGTYSQRGSEGVYVFELDRATGKLKKVQTVPQLQNPSFLDFDPKGKFLYVAGEIDTNGKITSFAIDQNTGKLKLINQKSAQGGGSCHITIDQTGTLAFVSNYGAGNIVVLPIKEDGRLGDASDIEQHSGKSINKERQEKPHVHSSFVSPDNRFLYVSDLGTDKIHIYEINHSTAKIRNASLPYIEVTPGAGPRHLAFHPNGKWVYSAEELYSSVCVLSHDKTTGALQIIQDTVKSLPDGFNGEKNTSADIHVDPQGKFLYMSNRGHDALSIFSIKGDGKIELIGHQEVMGKTPRSFFIDPKGEFVFVANQDSDNIVVFRMEKETGKLTYTGNQVKVPAPVCVKLLSNK